MNASKIAVALAGAMALAAAGSASATTTPVDLQVYNTHASGNNEMIAGDGIPIDNFTQDSHTDNGNTIYVSLKARDRDTGEASSQSGNYYYIDSGYSSTNPTKPNLSYDFQFDPGSDGTTNYYLQLKIDFNRSTATSFATVQGPITGYWDGSDGYFTNASSWNTSTVPYVISNSGHLAFASWASLNPDAANYDPNLAGDYEMQLNVFDPTDTTLLASTTIHAIVGNPLAVPVPEPGELGLMGFGLLLIGGLALRLQKNCRANPRTWTC